MSDLEVGNAIYFNRVTGEEYKLGFDYDPDRETELSKAWDFVSVACQVNGWMHADVFVRVGK